MLDPPRGSRPSSKLSMGKLFMMSLGYEPMPWWMLMMFTPIIFGAAGYLLHFHTVTIMGMVGYPFFAAINSVLPEPLQPEAEPFLVVFVLILVSFNVFTMYMFYNAMFDPSGGYEDAMPRKQPMRNESRLFASYLNIQENIPPFAIAVVAANLLDAPLAPITGLSIFHLAFRLIYLPTYWCNLPAMRTTVYLIGTIAQWMVFVVALVPSLAPIITGIEIA